MSIFEITFDPEVVEVAILTRQHQRIGTSRAAFKARPEKYWYTIIDVIAWQDILSGEIHEEITTLLARGATAKEFNKLIRFHAIAKIKVQKYFDGQDNYFLFLEKTQGGKFPILKEIKKNLRKKKAYDKRRAEEIFKENFVYKDEFLGDITFFPFLGNAETKALWLGEEIKFRFCCENEEQLKICINFAKELLDNQNEWDKRIRDFTSANLLPLANDWNEDCELTANELSDRISLFSIELDTNGEFEMMYDDDNIFLMHTIVVTGDLKNGPQNTDIWG